MLNVVKIADGVEGVFIENTRFNTTHISVNIYMPLERQRVAVNALLPNIITASSAEYPDFSALNRRLTELYGADVGGVSDKLGDWQWLRLFAYVLDDEYTLDNTPVVEQSAELLASLLFAPNLDGESFKKGEVEREKRLTLEKIEGMINDKRTYAMNRLLAEMYRGEPFGELKTGSAEDVEKITGTDLFDSWARVLKSSSIRIQVIGKEKPTKLFERFTAAFSAIERENMVLPKTKSKPEQSEVRRIDEPMDVSQGKLVMGFRSSFIGGDKETVHQSVLADLFGGGPYSKLFANVREKMSLCYYCAARANRTKGYLIVDSGVEAETAEKAEQEILNQFEALKKGDFTDDELAASVRSIYDSLLSYGDSQAALDGWYGMRPTDDVLSPEEFGELIKQVGREDVMRAAECYRLDTVYRLMPQGGESSHE